METDASEPDLTESQDTGLIQKFSKFESKSAKYTRNMQSQRFKEPRMFTMEQIRNMVFAVMNQSTMADRMDLNEQRWQKVHNTTIKLDEIDK